MENFEIINKLGSGGFSKVYKVKRKIDNKIYALKKVQLLNLSEKQKLSSLNEIRVLASIKSKYVVNYKEAFLDEKDSTLCLVMEYADRGDLANRIKEQKKKGKYFNERDIWRVFIQLVKGLKALHDLEILHRDIKSSNIFLFSDGTAKLGDLNVCKILSNNVLGHTQTGTPSYAAPEVWLEKPYGLKSDIWSLGCVLYEIISLHCPFRGENVVELYNKILIGEYCRIPNKFSDELNYIINHMINSDVNQRFSCDELLKCQYIKKRMNSNIKNGSNKKLKIYENEIKNNNNYNANNEYNNDIKNSVLKNNINRKLIFEDEEKDSEKKLLQTIYMPNNLLYLVNQLPKPNYSQEINNSRTSKSNIPVKISSELANSINFNLNKLNPLDNHNIHILNKKYTQDPSHCSPIKSINSNINSLFNSSKKSNNNVNNINDIINKDNSLYNNINFVNTNKMRTNIKLKHINSTLLSKNNNLSPEKKDIYYRTKSQDPTKLIIINDKNKFEENQEKDKVKENDFSEKEIEMKNHYFLDTEKLKAILCKKRIKKNHGIKDFKFKLKMKNNEDNEIHNDRYKNYATNNDYIQLPTDINSIENNNYKINIMNENSSINSINKFSLNNVKNYKLYKNEKEFHRCKTRKETFNILPKIKLSYIKAELIE